MWPFRRRKRDDAPGPGIPLPEHYGAGWDELWDRYVPARGQADTVQGELIRVTRRVARENFVNGCMNWSATFDAFCEYARRLLCDGTLPRRAADFADRTLRDMTAMGRWYVERNALDDDDPRLEAMEAAGPPVDVPETALAQVECLAELWCRAHPEPIPREPDPRHDF